MVLSAVLFCPEGAMRKAATRSQAEGRVEPDPEPTKESTVLRANAQTS